MDADALNPLQPFLAASESPRLAHDSGYTPLTYVRQWRMHIAARELVNRPAMTTALFKDLLEASRALRKRRRERVKRIRRLLTSDPAGADDVDARAIRALTGLSQGQFAELLGIEVATLRNWEQGRRTPTGPARALLRAINNNPVEVVRALHSERTTSDVSAE